ncbi:protein CUP-SHAPED COTYLEDON 1-like [Eutrema salsugineum]|uniref:protein CUP-SHAPED COTYLEDON 1-like n=1 Tax=Eutrema salsugineum TaxID=72664 RepID=UPI000CED08B0|nr:protein CUP-SHAPED COTYLEDON 1-like [Eutrema salsugineum]
MEEDHSVLSVDDDDQRIEPADEVIISYYLNMMINNGKSWPSHFFRDVYGHVYNRNPWIFFNAQSPNYLIFVQTRTEACGRTDDGCGSGCWRIIGRDKVIKSEETGKFLGFKKILKFCEKEKNRSEKRIWVMEEYRLVIKRKQNQVICKIRLLPSRKVSSLLAKHFSFLDNRNDWLSDFFVPWRLVHPRQSSYQLHKGSFFFVNRIENCGRTDGDHLEEEQDSLFQEGFQVL